MLHRLIRLLVVFALASGVSAAARADLLADVVSRGVIRIGVPADLIPFGYQNVNREP
jgi:ABC-type amino acid transport substrate-binding protein